MFDTIAKRLQAEGLVDDVWADMQRVRAEEIERYREYDRGEHHLRLSNDMLRMIQMEPTSDVGKRRRLAANYAAMVVNAMVDRLTLQGIRHNVDGGEDDPAQEWIDSAWKASRLDALQMQVHRAAVRDGVTFGMVGMRDVVTMVDGRMQTVRRAVLHHEPAWDGQHGIIPVYDGGEMVAAVKLYRHRGREVANVYYQMRIEYYGVSGDAEEVTVEERRGAAGLVNQQNGAVAGMPIVAFANEDRHDPQSELRDVLPLQDVLNSTLATLLGTLYQTGFGILFARGFEPDNAMSPGTIMHAFADADLTDSDTARAAAALNTSYSLERMEPGDLGQVLAGYGLIKSEIATVSSTPLPEFGADTASGESLKQREVGLLGKVRRAQTSIGNGWEDATHALYRWERAYGTQAVPEMGDVSAQWGAAELRSEREIIAAGKTLLDGGFVEEALRTLAMASSTPFGIEDVPAIMQRRRESEAASMEALMGSIPAVQVDGVS